MSIPFSVYYNPHQPETPVNIAPGGSAVIYEFDLRSLCPEYVGFICDLYVPCYPNCYIDWEIDRQLVERLRRRIGELRKPKLFDPPYFVRDSIKFTAYNNDKSSFKFEVLCDGLLIRRTT